MFEDQTPRRQQFTNLSVVAVMMMVPVMMITVMIVAVVMVVVAVMMVVASVVRPCTGRGEGDSRYQKHGPENFLQHFLLP